jgi:hypothetical protein
VPTCNSSRSQGTVSGSREAGSGGGGWKRGSGGGRLHVTMSPFPSSWEWTQTSAPSSHQGFSPASHSGHGSSIMKTALGSTLLTAAIPGSAAFIHSFPFP